MENVWKSPLIAWNMPSIVGLGGWQHGCQEGNKMTNPQTTTLKAYRSGYAKAINDATKAVPSSWLDPLLTKRTFDDKPVWTENLLNAVRKRIGELKCPKKQ